ncbi:hypothetical protein [Kamptonema sp. UHCC 0994]|uniref:hypothetical protein n=1 Tax=Kamptonema sp. UHCC 0994 TaxID=3031329 RepID=UPI0023B8C838|nr:hypothetical protein [Kamptonema sp. UHCC 0994]MDF0554053.1 hypothetical protein [Kamptonema sp. UHCC 0994]
MNLPSPDKTLLALLRALKNLEQPLTQSQRTKLFEIGEQLELDPDDWEFIYLGLIPVIADNTSLDQLFQVALNQLNATNNFNSQWLPNEKELSEALLTRGELEQRGDTDNNSPFQGQQIIQITVKVLKANNPNNFAQQLNWLRRIDPLFS